MAYWCHTMTDGSVITSKSKSKSKKILFIVGTL